MKKTILITGASRGIGKAIAYRLAAEKYDLILTCARNFDVLQNIAHDLESQYNIKCNSYKCDCSDSEQVKKLFLENREVDAVINNAGISYVGLLQDMEIADWDKIIQTNLSSVFYTSKYLQDSAAYSRLSIGFLHYCRQKLLPAWLAEPDRH